MTNNTSTHSPDALRAALMEQLTDSGVLRTPTVRTAFEKTPRHLFLPDHPPEDAYANKYVVTHQDENGSAISSASQPSVVARMLEQLAVEPGMRVLEIGAGTGYNTALLDQLVGPAGQVVTIDIEPDVTAAAREHLWATGHERVRVITGDGALGAPEDAPFDRIIATTGVWDIPPAWWAQLTTDGRMVIPFRWRGLTRSLALDHVDSRLVARDVRLCGFIPMQGQEGEKAVHLAEGITLHFDQDTPVSEPLAAALDTSRSEAWSKVRINGDTPLEGVWMRLACTEPGTGRMVTKPPALGGDLVRPAIPPLDPALVHGESLAYLSVRKVTDEQPKLELGAIGHGPEGQQLAERICARVREWEHNRDAVPEVTVYPAGTPHTALSGLVVAKEHSIVSLSLNP